jgi:hypothetical protein
MQLEGIRSCQEPADKALDAIPEAIVIEPADDRRDTDRLPCHREAWLHPVTLVKNDPWHAIVLAISTGGISLAIERRVPAGTFFAIELPDPLSGVSRMYAARVIHSESQGHGYWHLGCAFAVELSEAQLVELV